MDIGYFGPAGTYSQDAAEIFSKTKEMYNLIQFATIYDALNAVKVKTIKYAVVPIENSIEGSVNATLDMLAENEELRIEGEILLQIKHNLLVKRGVNIEDIELILSHPQALAQCCKYIQKHFQGIEVRQTLSTADGAKQVADSEGNWAAVANIKAAGVYGLKVLDESIEDEENNITRFVVVSLEDSEQMTGRDKTSIVFSTEDKPGSLYRILDIFNLWDINLTKIESRPVKNKLGKYIFYVDFEGHRNEQDIRDALTMVNRKTSFIRLLGSYPRIN